MIRPGRRSRGARAGQLAAWIALLAPAGAAAQPAAPVAPPISHGLAFPLRLGLGVSPLVGYSPMTYGWGETHTLDNGGWTSVELGPAVRVWRGLALELGLAAMIPVEDAWGFPDFRLAVIPAVRWDGARLYARAGVEVMRGDGADRAYRAAIGVRVYRRFYAGVTGFADLGERLGGGGLEIGVRLDDLRLRW